MSYPSDTLNWVYVDFSICIKKMNQLFFSSKLNLKIPLQSHSPYLPQNFPGVGTNKWKRDKMKPFLSSLQEPWWFEGSFSAKLICSNLWVTFHAENDSLCAINRKQPSYFLETIDSTFEWLTEVNSLITASTAGLWPFGQWSCTMVYVCLSFNKHCRCDYNWNNKKVSTNNALLLRFQAPWN